MKLTRKQLRKLIAEAFRYIVDDEGVAHPADDAFRSGSSKDYQSLGKNPKLDKLMQSTDIEANRQGRELAVTMDYQPELTDAEETAVEMGYDKATEPDLPAKHLDQPILAFKFAKTLEQVCIAEQVECNIKIDPDDFALSGIDYDAPRPVVVTITYPLSKQQREVLEEAVAEVYIYDTEQGTFMGRRPTKTSVAIEIYGDYDRDFVSYDFEDTKKFFDSDNLQSLAEAIFESAFRLVFYGDEEGVKLP